MRRHLKDFETGFDTLNYKLNRSLPKRKKKDVIGLMKDRVWCNKTKSIPLMRKTQKNCFSKQKLKFENYKHCLEASHLKNKIN